MAIDFDSELFKELSRIVVDELTRFMREVTGHENLEPGFVVCDQTFGTLPDSYHPHPHVCATDGGFLPDGSFVSLPRVRKGDIDVLCEVLRRRVLGWLVGRGTLREDLCVCLLGWEHSGFSLDASRRIPAGERDRLEDLLLYMSRHPFATGGIHYDPVSGTVHYQATREHQGRKTDLLITEAVEFISFLAQHIPHARRHQVRLYGAFSPQVRKRLGLAGKPLGFTMPARTTVRGRRSWARLIWKIYGIDPQICPKCGGERDIIAVILRDDVIVKILEHVGLPARLPALKPARAPPPRSARKQVARSLLPADDGFLVDPDYSEFDCIDEPTDIVEKVRESKKAPRHMSLLELVDHFPGKTLCWASDLLEVKKAAKN